MLDSSYGASGIILNKKGKIAIAAVFVVVVVYGHIS
jgi:hypothetical protein